MEKKAIDFVAKEREIAIMMISAQVGVEPLPPPLFVFFNPTANRVKKFISKFSLLLTPRLELKINFFLLQVSWNVEKTIVQLNPEVIGMKQMIVVKNNAHQIDLVDLEMDPVLQTLIVRRLGHTTFALILVHQELFIL